MIEMKTLIKLTRNVIAHGFWDTWEATMWFAIILSILKLAVGFAFQWVLSPVLGFMIICLVAQYRHEYKKLKNQSK